MLVLFETASGYAFFKLLDEKKIQTTDDIHKDFETPEGATKVIKLKHFEKFLDTTEALASTTAAVEGKLSKTLKKALKKIVSKEVQDKLLVSDAKLGNVIKEKLNLQCVANSSVMELMRCIRTQAENLLSGLFNKDSTSMSLGLAHSLSRYKLKFSPDKIDTMIIQAIGLLDDLDKELNNYAMRCREWYGWHFPELGNVITDNIVFAKVVKLVGTRDNIRTTDLSDILPEDTEEQVKKLSDFSMGTEISDGDIINIHQLCDQVIEVHTYRTDLYEYLKSRMMAIAPNVTVLLGELIGARLISHAGSLVNLAKHPASTVQILGAEKALFRALKTKKDTPKFGLIYHSQLVSQASARIKGKASRMLATKAALAIRFDALGEDSNGMDLGAEHKAKLEEKIRLLEEGNLKKISGTAKSKAAFEKYHSKSEVFQYPAADDSTMPSKKRKFEEDKKPLIEEYVSESFSSSPPKKKKKMQDQIKVEPQSEDEDEIEAEALLKKKKKAKGEIKTEVKSDFEDAVEAEAPLKEKKKIKGEIKIEVKSDFEDAVKAEGLKKKKKKKSKQEAEEPPIVEETHSILDESISKKKKKKIKEEPVYGLMEDEDLNIELKDESISKKKKKKIKEEPVYELMEVEDLNIELKGKKKKKKKATQLES